MKEQYRTFSRQIAPEGVAARLTDRVTNNEFVILCPSIQALKEQVEQLGFVFKLDECLVAELKPIAGFTIQK